jgi:two-component system sensor histidine kinase HydH
MSSKRVTYLPITSIVVVIVILAIALSLVSYRDIGRGRDQLSDMLWHQARGLLMVVGADLRSELVSPMWRPERMPTFFDEVRSAHSGVAYLALLDEDGRVVAHSDTSVVGQFLPDADKITEMPVAGRTFMHPERPGRAALPPAALTVGERIFESDGRRIYEYRVYVNLPPLSEVDLERHGMGRGMRWRMTEREPPALSDIARRLEDLLGRSVDPNSPTRLTAVTGLDATDLEAAIRTTRNYTLLLAVVLLLVGGAAIYFLFVTATYRSTRTALENMRSYTSNIIESMRSGLVSLDAGGNVVTVNAGARSILGLGPDDITGRAAGDVLKVESDPDGREIRSVLDGRADSVELETRVAGSDGTVPVALSASALRDEDGERAGTVLLFQDLREIEELKDAVERERHLASLGRLAAGVAHEVRNPLSSLKGFAQFFRTKFAPGSEEERYSDIMIEEVERLDRVVQELLDFARPVAPSLKPTPPNSIIEEALALVSEDAQFRSVTVERRLAEGLPDVSVDPMQMRQALLNVFLNAIEAMGEGGTMTVETSETKSLDGKRTVSLGITDTGPGMRPEELDKLFEPFYTTKPKGSGLGMTVVSRVVEQNGGRVHVSSAPGEGTTLTFVLPVA